MQNEDLTVSELGRRTIRSPLPFSSERDSSAAFVDEAVRIRYRLETGGDDSPADDLTFELAGARGDIFFDPPRTTAAIVTCGGLSPGLNNVICSAQAELTRNYGVTRVLGIRQGYLGLTPQGKAPVELTREYVSDIHKLGGTVLGTSRGPQDPGVIVDFLHAHKIDLLFCVGGDGTQRGAFAIHEEVRRRGLPIAVVGIPKTIDNDVPFVDLSFGYATALEQAGEVVRGAHIEARDAVNGIGVVKLMGRQAGFIAAGATLVAQEVNFTLIPEIEFRLEGKDGLLSALEGRIREREHAVIVVAEGAGQHLFPARSDSRDASGNVRFRDIGPFLGDSIKQYFTERGVPVALKYIDPSYSIRSVPAGAYDRMLCDQMARHAVHAAMAGKTGMLVAFRHRRFVHVPIPTVVREKKTLDVAGDLWKAVLQVTGQPHWQSCRSESRAEGEP